MAKQFTVTFKRDTDPISSGAFGLWLDAIIRGEAEDDPDSDHGPFTITLI